ncbi:MAG: hypothetical protein M1818_003149 [Claussenomyces sp. TS43310]|nr:MAG: hypothetical protein M1818_003149 [Claussenomyces sp. TS43310]
MDSDEELPDLADVFKTFGVAELFYARMKSSLPSDDVPQRLSLNIEDMSCERENFSGLALKKTEREVREPKLKRCVILSKQSKSRLLQPLETSCQIPPRASRLTRSGSSEAAEATRVMPPRNSKPLEAAKVVADGEESDHPHKSDNMSEFVISDSSYSEHEHESLPRPKPTRILTSGKRLQTRSTCDEELPPETSLESLERPVVESTLDMKAIYPGERNHENASGLRGLSISQRGRGSPRELNDGNANSDLEEPFPELVFPPFEKYPPRVCKELRSTTPPSNTSKPHSKLPSRKKLGEIPPSPHRQIVDAFWNQDTINEWNDEFSPRKMPKKPSRLVVSDDTDFSSEHQCTSPKKSPAKHSKPASEIKKIFAENKHTVAAAFLSELDEAITSGQISKMASSTGGVSIVWSRTLNTTAGRANWKRETARSKPSEGNNKDSIVAYHHYASIELAEKIIDDENRLLNVIAHEFCHLANFMVSGIKDRPHGKHFKAWAAKCTAAFGRRGIEVTTKHSYAIDYKYVWTCSSCSMQIGRHSKSIDPIRHQCGVCKCKLLQTKPTPRGGFVSQYQMFVRENMKKVKEENPGSPQREIMGLIGKRYQEHKASELKEETDVLGKNIVAASRTYQVDVDSVVIKLDFLDLKKEGV